MNTARNVNLYRRLSALYPKSFRDEYRDDLVATFVEQLRDGRATVVWMSTLRDLAVTVPTQHLEARMHRPAPHTVAVIATAVTVAGVLGAFVVGTGPVMGLFLLAAIAALIVATLAWKAARRADGKGTANASASRWRTYLVVGGILLAVVVTIINVPPYNSRELPEGGWALMMLSMLTSIGLISIGLTKGFAQRAAQRSDESVKES